MSLAFKRMYVDIPAETHDKLKILAVKRGMSQKALLADLIEQACKRKSPTKKGTTSKRKTKRRSKR